MRPNRHVTTYFRHVWTSLIKGTLYTFVRESPDLIEQKMTDPKGDPFLRHNIQIIKIVSTVGG